MIATDFGLGALDKNTNVPAAMERLLAQTRSAVFDVSISHMNLTALRECAEVSPALHRAALDEFEERAKTATPGSENASRLWADLRSYASAHTDVGNEASTALEGVINLIKDRRGQVIAVGTDTVRCIDMVPVRNTWFDRAALFGRCDDVDGPTERSGRLFDDYYGRVCVVRRALPYQVHYNQHYQQYGWAQSAPGGWPSGTSNAKALVLHDPNRQTDRLAA